MLYTVWSVRCAVCGVRCAVYWSGKIGLGRWCEWCAIHGVRCAMCGVRCAA